MKRIILAMIVLLSLTLFTAGCSTISSIMQSDSIAAELIVKATTARVLSERSSWIPATVVITVEGSGLKDCKMPCPDNSKLQSFRPDPMLPK